ncbi:SAM-dependent methyltransferase [Buchnera aphidicola (Mollitrichosiphum nigrofasciatum)]|uniref:RlmE family RNA methyltransferase n=1 Tax=Buchnera aphidicola TaxID=9 RepID=UPI0031B8065C
MFYKKYSKSSKRWLNEHFNDIYVKYAYKKKKRSRAWFKLDEINKRNNILKSGMNVLDLGSAPGSWAEYIIEKIGNGLLVACDIISIIPIKNVKFIKGDIRNAHTINKILSFKKINVVFSDMAPNFSGLSFIDMNNMTNLLQLSLFISLRVLVKGGSFITKAFEGIEMNIYLKKLKLYFSKVRVFKPKSSRARSREVYIIAFDKIESNVI